MRKLSLLVFLMAALLAATLCAEHAYERIAEVHDIMEAVQKPSMDKIVAINKAGGPKSEEDWKQAKMYASILAESTQLLLMAGRVKDDVWEKGAHGVIAGAKSSISAADAHDVNAWRGAAGQIGRGCRGCHKAHKPKKEKN